HLDLHSSKSRVDSARLGSLLAALGADGASLAAAAGTDSAAQILAIAGAQAPALAEAVAMQGREGALATLCGKTAVEVAIVGRDGGFRARVGGGGPTLRVAS